MDTPELHIQAWLRRNQNCHVMSLDWQLLAWSWLTLNLVKIEQGGICKFTCACVCLRVCVTEEIGWLGLRSSLLRCHPKNLWRNAGAVLGHNVIPQYSATTAKESPWGQPLKCKEVVTAMQMTVCCMLHMLLVVILQVNISLWMILGFAPEFLVFVDMLPCPLWHWLQ